MTAHEMRRLRTGDRVRFWSQGVDGAVRGFAAAGMHVAWDDGQTGFVPYDEAASIAAVPA